MTAPYPVAVAVIVQADRVLLIRRRVTEGALSWQFPGGKIEQGETPEQAAVREAAEETSLRVGARQVLGDRGHPDTGRHVFYVACNVLAGMARVESPAEVAEVRWCSLGESATLVPGGFHGPVRDYLEYILRARPIRGA